MAVNSGCSSRCSLEASDIRDSRLVCCDEQKDEVAFQAKIYGVDNNELKNKIQKWVDSEPQIEGWNTVLRVSDTWQFGLSDNALLDSEAECESSTSDSPNDGCLNVSVHITIALSAALGIALILLVLMLVVTCATVRWHKKKYKKTTVDTRYVVSLVT